ncbi:MAG: kelch repeat-containing protein [Bacteroidota bacterium]
MKKCLFFLFLAISTTSFGQNAWFSQKDFDGLPRYNAASFALDSGCYIGAGVVGSGTFANDFWKWDWQSNTWSQKANIPGAGRYGAAGFNIGNKGYVAMGHNGTSMLNDLQEYDPLTNTWTAKANFPGTARYTAAAFSIGTKAYICCGSPGAPPYLKDCWEYNQLTNSWSQKADVGSTSRNHPAYFVVNGKGYVATGNDDSYGFQNDVWMYDPALNSWIQKSNYPGNPLHASVGFSINGSGFMGTGKIGDSGPVFTNEFYEYFPSTDSWVSRAPYPGVLSAATVGFSHDGKGYIGCGVYTNGTYSNEFWEYRPITYGIEELKVDFNIYPNPNNGSFAIRNLKEGYSITMFDLSGKEIPVTCKASGGDYIVNINNNVDAGCYLLSLRKEDKSFIKKIIIQ